MYFNPAALPLDDGAGESANQNAREPVPMDELYARAQTASPEQTTILLIRRRALAPTTFRFMA